MNIERHLKAWEEFYDSNPIVSGDFSLIIFTSGDKNTALQKIHFRPNGLVSFDDLDSEYKDRRITNQHGGWHRHMIYIPSSHSPPIDHRTYDVHRMIAVGSEEEHFQRSVVEDNILPMEFNTWYNMLLNLAWIEMYKFRI